ncbi:MAG: hypothetical protein S4CHLAM123_04150 [Chlamydiales bacterium]|nr:hypothetical protein [Chlamydiales bacterium]
MPGLELFVLPIAPVQIERMMHPAKKTTANHAVIFLRISGVDVPKRESPESPPNEAPNPELLLS